MDSEMEKIEEKGISQVVSLAGLAARTAPKAKGTDNLTICALSNAEKENLAKKMEKIASEGYLSNSFSRDAQNVRQAQAVLLIGTKLGTRGLDCGFCGFETCAQCKTAKARCAHDLVDLGIAVGSAVSIAADHRVDNRIMFTIGYAVTKYKLLDEKVKIVFGIPLSATGKNIFFDRK